MAIVLEEQQVTFFDDASYAPLMTRAAPARNVARELAPAVIHRDGSTRIQTLRREDNEVLHAVLTSVHEQIGVPILIDTSFNVAGEPIVDTPDDALRSFLASGADVLYVNGCRTTSQQAQHAIGSWT